MIPTRSIAVVALVALGFSLPASAQFGGTLSNKELQQRAEQTDARIAALESRLNQALLDLQRQVEGSQQELRTLRGQIEEARHELEMVRQQQHDLPVHVERSQHPRVRRYDLGDQARSLGNSG